MEGTMDEKLDPAALTDFIDAILRALPANSRIADGVEQSTTVWLLMLEQALSQIENSESIPLFDVARFQHVTQAWLNPTQMADLPSEQLASIAYQAVVPSTVTDVALSQPAIATSPEVDEATRENQNVTPHDATSSRLDVLWDIATARDKSQIQQQSILATGKPPFDAPQPQDLVVRGTRYTGGDVAPLWLVAAAADPLFALSFPELAKDAHIWLSFTEPVHTHDAQTPQWIREHPETFLLWQRWQDLRCWAILAPKAAVFINEKQEQLALARHAICKTLSTIHRNFEHALHHPDQNLIGINLHKVYAAFYQILLPEDLDANQVAEQGVFACLRTDVRRSSAAWLDHLQIEQKHPTGPPRTREFLPGVMKNAPRNIRLSKKDEQDGLLRTIATPRQNQVVYWLKPNWHQANPPPNASPVLPGSVLYVFD